VEQIPVLPEERASRLARRIAELIAEIGALRQGAERDVHQQRREVIPSSRV
jgi:hypothetical protein